MAATFHDVALQALSLDESDRLRLASELIDSVEGAEEPGWSEVWLRELEARRARGTEDAVPWEEARARVLRRLTGS
ncbi:MAG: addiction module protein [Alphaproteobacteria bacterium]|nr:addiction module protein [Alphaproteobacteria bacterium]